MHYAVVMAGGGGTRLWPAARRKIPKQLQKLIFERPLIAETVGRLSDAYPIQRILIVTAQRYADQIAEILPDFPEENIISEPFGRDTAAAIALAALHIHGEDPDGIFAVFPADHVILNPDALFRALEFANRLAAEHRVVDIGVPATEPETGYGYIELGDQVAKQDKLAAYAVRRFVEKPDMDIAQRYVDAGNYVWNSGMFVWRAAEYLKALSEHLPNTHRELTAAVESRGASALTEAYERIEKVSVDYAVMEKTEDVIALPVDFGWRDVGDWSALYDLMEHDENGNAFEGAHVYLDTSNCMMLSPKKLVAAIGVRDLIVVDTEDALLIMPRDRSQDVKKILDQLEQSGRSESL